MRFGCLAALALLLAGCARLLPPPQETEAMPAPPSTASLSVEVWHGFTQQPAVRLPETSQVELIVDLTRSMRVGEGDGLMRLYGARESAALLVERLPEATVLDVHVLGVSRQGACSEATRVASGAIAPLRDLLPGRLRRLIPDGEGSLARTLAAIAAARAGAAEEARVVAFTDLDPSCGGDLCSAARALVATGAQLELVLFGPASPPACLAELTAPPRPLAAAAAAPPPLRLEAGDGSDARAGIRADGRTVDVPSGPATLVVEGRPVVEIGPLALRPGTRTRIQVLDFPSYQPPLREWRWQVEPVRPSQPAEAP